MNNEIIENNVLIEEFMEGEFNANGDQVKPKGLYAYGGCYNIENLRYHSSYDWLIPVIDKIYDTGLYDKYLDEKISIFGEREIINTKYIIRTFERVVDFIKWYNQNK